MASSLNAVFYSQTYHPIQAGSIDGTDTAPHDNGVYRAVLATSTGLYDPTGDPKAEGNPNCVVFVGRLSKDTTEATLEAVMSKYGRVKNLRLVRHIVTGASQGYAFVEYESEKEMRYAYEAAHRIKIDGSEVLVDYNRQMLMPGWIPRRFGGGLGGRKESGQLRFGGRDRPFRKPLRPIPHKELEKLGIPLPPEGHYLSRFEIPPLPKKRSDIPTARLSRYQSSQSHDKISSQENSHNASELKKIKLEKLKEECSSQEDDDRSWHHQRHEHRRDRNVNDDVRSSFLKEGRRWHHQEDDDRSWHHQQHEHRRDRNVSDVVRSSFLKEGRSSEEAHDRRAEVQKKHMAGVDNVKEECSSQEDDGRSWHHQRHEHRRDHNVNDDVRSSLLKEGRSSEEAHERRHHKSRRPSKAERTLSDSGNSETDDKRCQMNKQEVKKERRRYADHDDDYIENKMSQKRHRHDQNYLTRSVRHKDGYEHSNGKGRQHEKDDSQNT